MRVVRSAVSQDVIDDCEQVARQSNARRLWSFSLRDAAEALAQITLLATRSYRGLDEDPTKQWRALFNDPTVVSAAAARVDRRSQASIRDEVASVWEAVYVADLGQDEQRAEASDSGY